jgi:hypothetical protein
MICDLLESGLRGKKARRLNRTLSRFDGPPPIVICLRVQMSRVMHEAAPRFYWATPQQKSAPDCDASQKNAKRCKNPTTVLG